MTPVTTIKINSINLLNSNGEDLSELLAIIKYIFKILYKF